MRNSAFIMKGGISYSNKIFTDGGLAVSMPPYRYGPTSSHFVSLRPINLNLSYRQSPTPCVCMRETGTAFCVPPSRPKTSGRCRTVVGRGPRESTLDSSIGTPDLAPETDFKLRVNNIYSLIIVLIMNGIHQRKRYTISP